MPKHPAPTPTPARACALFRRVSLVRQAEGYGFDAQEKDCEAYADSLGLRIVRRFEDMESGANLDSPGLNAMLDAARAGEFDTIITFEPDRFARGVAKQLTLEEEFKRYGVAIRYAKFKLEDTSEGRLFKNQLALFAEYEREKTAFRTSRGRREKAERGLVVGSGPAPYGYRYVDGANGKVVGLEPDPDTAPILQRIVRDLARMSTQAVADALNAEGVPTPLTVNATRLRRPHGEAGPRPRQRPRQRQRALGQWTTPTIRGMLANPVYLGTATFRRHLTRGVLRPQSEWFTASVPPLLTPDALAEAREAMRERKIHRPARMDVDPFSLRGRVFCGLCGGVLACLPNTGHRYYACLRSQPRHAERQGKPVCGLPDVRGDAFTDAERARYAGAVALEDIAWEAVIGTVLDPEALATGLAEARAAYDADRFRQRERLAAHVDTLEAERAQLKRYVAEQLNVNTGPAKAQALGELVAGCEERIAKLEALGATLGAEPVAGLSAEDVDALTAFVAQLGSGELTPEASASARARIYELLKLRGTVRLADADEHGYRVGRNTRRFAVAWQASLPLKQSNGGTPTDLLNLSFDGSRLTATRTTQAA